MLQNVADTENSDASDEQDRSGEDLPAPADSPHDDEPVRLTHRQITALPYLLSSGTVAEGAKLAGISRTTFYRWMDDEAFRTQFETLRADVQRYAYAELRGLTLKGALVLAQMLEDPSSGIKLRAAQTAVSAGMKVSEQMDNQDRLDRIDEALSIQKSRKTIL